MKIRNLALAAFACMCFSWTGAQNAAKTIELIQPDLKRGSSLMDALSERKSTREFATRELSSEDLSGLLWAANGINRPDGKRTAPSALNKQDIKVYVCLAQGSYLYNPALHSLELLSEGDARQRTDAPVMLVLASDTKEIWGALDAGIVSQNISLYCAAMKMGTVVRGSMDQELLRKALKLADEQTLYLNHPTGYFKD